MYAFLIMNTFARTAKPIKIDIIPTSRPFSIFEFVENKFQGLPSLHRILSQMREHGGNTIVDEEIVQAGDIREENEDLAKHCSFSPSSSVHRISFFSKSFSTTKGLDSCENNEFLGYAIVKSDVLPSRTINRVYESVIMAHRHDNYYVRSKPEWKCIIANTQFKIQGYLYAQQNNLTNVCAHVAIRTAAARFHKAGDMSYREMNNIIGIDHITNKIGDGLTTQQMTAILEAAGAKCFIGDYTIPESDIVSFQKYIYGSVESGYPSIICFGVRAPNPGYHAVPVFGHTFNSDMWVPQADFGYFEVGKEIKYIPSESWVSTFVAHDDNFGSNYCIPKGYLYSKPACTRLGKDPVLCPEKKECIAYVIGTLPKEVEITPIKAEVIGAEYLFAMMPQIAQSFSKWSNRLRNNISQKRLVLRPILINFKDYVEHLEKTKSWEGDKISKEIIGVLQGMSNHKIWMVEISLPELFPTNRRKIGEILLRAEIPCGTERDFKSFLLARLPGCFVLYRGSTPDSPSFSLIPNGITSHIELYGCEEEG